VGDNIIMGQALLEDRTRKVQHLASSELSNQVQSAQDRIEQGTASDQDYLVFIMCQLELAERGAIQS